MERELFISNSTFGEVEILEVYDFYDQPLLFSAIDRLNRLYFVYNFEGDLTIDRWLMVSVSEDRLKAIRKGGVDIRSALANPETKQNYIITCDKKNGFTYSTRLIETDEINLDLLPISGFSLNIEEEIAYKLFQTKIKEKSDSSNRIITELIFHLKNTFSHEAPVKLFTDVLSEFQSMVFAAADLIHSKSPSLSGPFSSDTMEIGELLVMDVSPSSFKVILGSSNFVDLYGNSKLIEPINIISNLFNIGDDLDSLKSEFEKFNPRLIKNYYYLLSNLVSEDLDHFEFNWVVPKAKTTQKSSITREIANKVKTYIELSDQSTSEEFIIFGKLVAASIPRKTCEIIDNELNKVYECRQVSESLIEGRTLGTSYKARIQKIMTKTPSTGLTKDEHILLNLTDL